MNQARSSAPRGVFARVKRLAGFDPDVLHTLLFRSWAVLAGALTVALIPVFLGSVQQGYYYTFASLLGLQIFFELGLNQVILQLVSHGVAHGGDPAHARIRSLVALLKRWYAVAAVAFFLLVSAGGAAFLSTQPLLPWKAWLPPWICLVLATAANLYLSALLTVLEGSGQVATVARLRLRMSLFGYSAMWLTLAAGGALWAVVLVPLVSAAVSMEWLRARASTFEHLLGAARLPADAGPVWRRDVLPLQWRIALSWISGYFIFQLLTPLAFARQGPVDAGRLGITLAVFNAVLTTGMSWVNAKFPALASHLARGERAEANALFRAVTLRAVAFTASVSAALLAVLAALQHLAPAVAQRFASPAVAACIVAVTLANTFIFAAAAYLRAHKEEPMLAVSLVSGLAMLLAVSAGSSAGVLPMMALYMAVTLLLSLPWTVWVFRAYYLRPA